MGKFDGILICTDLDGTLLKDDKTISRENFEAIEYFKANGGLFSFVTGRMPVTTRKIIDMIKPNCPFGCINGGGLYDFERNKYVWNTHISPEFVHLVKCAEEHIENIGYQANTFDEVIFCRENSAMARFRLLTGTPDIRRSVDRIEGVVAKIVFGDENPENINLIEKLCTSHPLAHKFSFVRSERTLFEILPKDVNKGKALKMLCEYLNIDIRKTVAVGDYTNDVEMIKAAGVGIAVENANEDAKAASDYITVSNDEDAIARVIEDIESGKISFGERK